MKGQIKNVGMVKAALVALIAMGAAGAANAAAPDFSSITSGIDSSTVVTAIIAMGVILALPGFAKWATKKVAGFFG